MGKSRRKGAALSAIERGVSSVAVLRVTSRRQVGSCSVQIAYFPSSGCNRRTRRILREWSDYEIYEIYDNGAFHPDHRSLKPRHTILFHFFIFLFHFHLAIIVLVIFITVTNDCLRRISCRRLASSCRNTGYWRSSQARQAR